MIYRFDHIVLTVNDIISTLYFYTSVLDMEEVTFGNGRKALRFGEQKINLHKKGAITEPKDGRPTPGSYDLCFLSERLIKNFIKRFKELDIEIIEGPVLKNGATGQLYSVYIRDPDGNLLEIANRIKS